MIDASQLPRVPSELLQEQQAAEYVRAPLATGGVLSTVRPPATQDAIR